MKPDRIPEVILVRKTYPNRRKRNRTRNWKLRSIAKEAQDAPEDHAGLGRAKIEGSNKKGARGMADQAKVEAEYELFLRDLEEDPELRQNVLLFKADPKSKKAEVDSMEIEGDAESVVETEMDEDDDFPKIQLDELLDEMEALKIREEALAEVNEVEEEE
jgi:nonsense-mediated mRNA decay protein 3